MNKKVAFRARLIAGRQAKEASNGSKVEVVEPAKSKSDKPAKGIVADPEPALKGHAPDSPEVAKAFEARAKKQDTGTAPAK
jgi:hypothetical protein